MNVGRPGGLVPVLVALLSMLVASCGGGGFDGFGGADIRLDEIPVAALRFDAPDVPDVPFDPGGWSLATHGKGADPDYDEVFPVGRVVAIDLQIKASTWASMLKEMATLFGAFGGAGVADASALENPTWQRCTVRCNGLTWWYVGIRFKGASSLQGAWVRQSLKLPFKLDFDEFEDDHPEIDNQRFYGFKKLAFANSVFDKTCLRDKVTGDLFRSQGHRSSAKAFYRVTLDVGHGPVYLGLYTASENPADKTFLEDRFGNDDGNVYKPHHSPAAQWQPSTAVNEFSFPKKSNEDESDWSDVEAAIAALNASRADAAAWRAGLEATFDGFGFMHWLAINTAVKNWDAYGLYAHNHYLYGDEAQGNRLRWIVWDLDLAFGNNDALLPFDMSTVTEAWPLIRFLYDDPVYRAAYDDALRAFLDTTMDIADIHARFQAEADLVAPHVLDEDPALGFTDAAEFAMGVEGLKAHAAGRHAEGRAYLND